MMFKILWGFDALITLVILYFFFLGIADGTVSSFNAIEWTCLVLIPMGILAGSIKLRSKQPVLAGVLLWILAIPGLIGVLYLMIILVGNPRFN